MTPPRSSPGAALLALLSMLAFVACRGGGEAWHSDHDDHDHGHGGAEGHDEHEDHGDEGEHAEGEEGEHDDGVVELPEGSLATIRLAPVERRALESERETTGRVDWVQTTVAHVSPRITGRVQRVFAALGEDVKAGQVVLELDSVEVGRAKAALAQARAREELARRTYEREKGLHEERISSESDLLAAEAAWQEARSSADAASQELRLLGIDDASASATGAGAARISVRSPIAGRIVDHHATVGELVSPETHLMTVADPTRVWVWIDVPERDVAAVHQDDDVEVRSDAHPADVFTGKVSYTTPEVDADTRTVRARIEVGNPGRKLLPGMFVRVRIVDPHVEGGSTDPLVVPEAAILRQGEGAIVFVAAGDHRYQRRDVRIGRTTPSSAEVLDGVSEGEQVVVEGAFVLKSQASRHALGGGHSH